MCVSVCDREREIEKERVKNFSIVMFAFLRTGHKLYFGPQLPETTCLARVSDLFPNHRQLRLDVPKSKPNLKPNCYAIVFMESLWPSRAFSLSKKCCLVPKIYLKWQKMSQYQQHYFKLSEILD